MDADYHVLEPTEDAANDSPMLTLLWSETILIVSSSFNACVIEPLDHPTPR